jgi:hypothetical protein
VGNGGVYTRMHSSWSSQQGSGGAG